MNRKIRHICLFLFALWAPALFAQNVSIQLQDAGISQYQSIFVSDFDFLQVGAVEELFTMTVTKSVQGVINDAVLKLQLQEQDGPILANITTEMFSLPSDLGQWTVSNQQLANESFKFEPAGQPIRIADSGIDDNADKLRDEIIASNQIPAGVYTLKADLSYTNPETQQQETATGLNVLDIIISNPTMINLVVPGVLLNSGFAYEIFTQQPVFQYNGNSGDYQVVVFKKRDEFSSVDDILNSVPVWESPRIAELFVQYPDGGAVPLEFGSTYVWMVRSFIRTSSGENYINSELWEFTVVDPSQSNITQESMAKQEIEILLRQLLGDNADAIIKEIDNYDLRSIRINGASLTVQELYQVLEKYRENEHQVYDLILRSSN